MGNPPRVENQRPEFDAFAEGYSAGMENPVKRLAGKGTEQFMDVKTRWLSRYLRKCPVDSTIEDDTRLLDYGCGTGELLASLQRRGFRGHLEGCDISGEMLKEAARRLGASSKIVLHHVARGSPGVPSDSFDLVTMCAVLHHLPHSDEDAAIQDIARVLRPGGRAVIFEHNPWNPVTRWVVSRTPIDRNAVLRTAGDVQRLLRSSGLTCVRLDYLLFFPPRLPWLAPLERLLRRVPLGGQYVLVGKKPMA
ncbi:MAG: class I SAM-dependent methyltransferase [Acidobacteriota bacterium]